MSIYYTLRRRLGQRQPIAVFMSDQAFYLFCEAGVAKILPQYIVDPNLLTGCWLVVDSSAAPTTFPERVVMWGSLLVFVSSPNHARWGRLRTARDGDPGLIYMNPWSRREIAQGWLRPTYLMTA